MSGPFGSQQWMYSSGFYPHEINSSVRFYNNTQLSRTPSSTGNMRTWTFSAWVKRSKFASSAYDGVFSAGSGGTNRDVLYFDNNDKLRYNGYTSSSYDWNYTSTQKFRDPASWYHIVIATDTNQDTYSDRIKIYVNGVQITAWDTDDAPNRYKQGYVNNTNEHTIGSTPYDTTYLDGYVAEVNFVDGTQLAPTDFGETKSGTWIPKKYTGSYGSNGYYLKFGNSGSLGTDSSGNGNTWTATNIVATDQVLDSPTNNFATFNPFANGSWTGWSSYSEGAVQIVTPATGGGNGQCTIGVPSSGKWYYEAYVKASDANVAVAAGFCNTDARNQYPTASSTSIWYNSYGGNSYLTVNGSNDSYSTSSGVAVGDIIGVSYDGTNVKFYKNNSLIWTKAYDATGLVPYITDGTGSSDRSTVLVNFGQDSSFAGNKTAQGNTDANGRGDFYYSPPSGHLALCTANLPDPPAAFNPAVDNTPQDHFNPVLFTANNGTQSITGVGFAPELIWAKSRGNAYNHDIYDIVRGTGKHVSPNTTQAETSTTNTINSFDSDGFTLGVNSNANYGTAASVAWNWKLGGSGVSNSDGTISSTVSANTDAGVSVVTYNGSSAGTVGHGLSSTPELVIQKTRDTTGDYWWTGTTVIDGSMDFFKLNDTDVKADSSYTAPTSSVFSNVTFSGATSNVAYCFHSVEGFSKIGVYLDNGSAYGPIIYTGFRPAWVMIKRVNGTENWYINDTTRSTYNPLTNATLYANLNTAEGTGHAIDYLSNGFRIANSNTAYNGSNTGSYLYIAFAEMPFKYANAR